jgi:hypothetical protein
MARIGRIKEGEARSYRKGPETFKDINEICKKTGGNRAGLADALAHGGTLRPYESKSFIFPKCSKAFLVA